MVQNYYRTNFGQESVSNRVRISWNNLPKDITQIPSKKSFKDTLKWFYQHHPTPYKNYHPSQIKIKKIKKTLKKTNFSKQKREKLELAIDNIF